MMCFDESPFSISFPSHPSNEPNQFTINLSAARAPFGRRNFLLFLIGFLKNLQPHMATPSRVEDWFQLVPHFVWEEGANPAGSPLPWNHGGSDLCFQCPSTKCGGWGWRSLCNELCWPIIFFGDGVWDERCIISQYFSMLQQHLLCSCLQISNSKGSSFSESCRRCQRILMRILQAK